MQIINWITENYTTVLAIVGGVQIVAVAVTKLTPNTKDDAVVSKVFAFIEKIASFLSVKPKAK